MPPETDEFDIWTEQPDAPLPIEAWIIVGLLALTVVGAVVAGVSLTR